MFFAKNFSVFRLMILKYMGFLSILFFISQQAYADTSWIRANFHGHSKSDLIHDDGTESTTVLHEQLIKKGVQFSVHSIHSVFNPSKQAASAFIKQKQKETLSTPSAITISVGEELTVQKGPHYQGTTTLLGHSLPGNLNHITLLGIKTWVPDGTPLAKACQEAHRQGGICLVNHPGLGMNPSPMMWEPGLWEDIHNRSFLDGLEVYNGVGYAASGLHFEGRYLEATAFSKLGIKMAATASSDTHGVQHLKMVKQRFEKAGALAALLGLKPPSQSAAHPELEAMTLVNITTPTEKKIIEAIQKRKTIAAYQPGNIEVTFPELGEVKNTKNVNLHLTLSQKAKRISLYKEGVLQKSWTEQNQVHFQENISQKAAYVFAIELANGGRLMTSAVWYEPSG